MNRTIARIIYYCILVGLTCNFVRLYLQQRDVQLIMDEAVYPWYFQLSFLGNVLICAASVMSFFLYRKYFPSFITTCYLLLILWVTIASFSDFSAIFKRTTFFFSIKGIGTYINFGLLFFAADTERFPKVLKFFYYACFFFIIAGYINLGTVGLGASRKDFLYVIKDSAFFCVWVFPYFFLQPDEDKRKNLFHLGTFLLIVLLVFFTGARSYLIISMVILMVKFSKSFKSQNGIFAIVGLIVLVIGGYLIISNSQFSGSLDNALDNFSERSVEDTRSDQIFDFLSQYDLEYLWQGVGPLGLWYWNSIGDYYGFLDNQFLLLSWWAGLPAIITYMYFLIKSLFIESEIRLFQDVRATKLMIGFWICACLGLAIYVTICSDPYYYFISFMIGLNACQYTKIIEPEID
ncbi:MAG: hypothetical protein V4685_19555 [Bacteroidota bacterium]